MDELSGRLKALGKKLSICVGYYAHNHDTPPHHGFIDPDAVERSCDEVRVMCYDQYFAPGKGREPFDRLDCQAIGATSTQPWARTAMQHWAKSISHEKLVMGLPAYSNDYDATPRGFGRHFYTSVPPANNWIVDRTWLWFDKVNLYRYLDEQGAPHIFYASDAESTRAHLETAAAQGISAISFWHGRSVSEAMWQEARQWRDAER
jgi:spore germination protein YaaH